MTGNRKIKVFYGTMILMGLTILGSLMAGVKFAGSDITAILAIMGTTSGMFFGANFGEHWSQRVTQK